jgi:hypothetical protein
MMCSVLDSSAGNHRHYTRDCSETEYQEGVLFQYSAGYTSVDLLGKGYGGVCPYYSSCALNTDPSTATCESNGDYTFSFIGRDGRVAAIDNLAGTIQVTFNDGRTAYEFAQDTVKIESAQRSMYEMWWVLRTASGSVVQKRKGFNVTSPACTFDANNNR